MQGNQIELFSARLCPYAHRTRLVLGEKAVPFELIEVDLQNKSRRFLSVSPYGKVPALVHNGQTVYESAIINEYLDEVFTTRSFMPADPLQRAKVRIWVDYCDDYFLADHYALLKNQDLAQSSSLLAKARSNFVFLEQGLAQLGGPGPFWLGGNLSLLDFAWYPFFERLPAWTYYRGLEIPAECPRLKLWLAAMSSLPSVREIANDADFYIPHYLRYAGQIPPSH